MVTIDKNDGKTRETAIKILTASDHREGWKFIYNFIGNFSRGYKYEDYTRDDITTTNEGGFLKELSVYRKSDIEIWIDWTTLFHVWDK